MQQWVFHWFAELFELPATVGSLIVARCLEKTPPDESSSWQDPTDTCLQN